MLSFFKLGRILFFAFFWLIAGSAHWAFAQNAGDIINLFGGLMQGAIAQANNAEWQKVSQRERACVDQALRQNGMTLQTIVQQGITPTDSRIADIRTNCQAAARSEDRGFRRDAGSAAVPSFDCSKASYPDERAICSNIELAQLDVLVAAGYEFVRQKFGEQFARTTNAPFFQERRACGANSACIKVRQINAINRFRQLGAPIEFASTDRDDQLLWNLNGSTLYLVAKGKSRRFVYKEPRPAMRSLGVEPGSVLFDGEVYGETYQGTAFFSSQCGRSPVHVVGPILDSYRRVELHGQKPNFNGSCRIVGYIDSTLALQLIEPVNPAPAVTALPQAANPVSEPPAKPAISQREADLFKTTKEAALAGDAKAQLALSAMYQKGSGVDKDPSESVAWLRKSADQGNPQAQARLGDAYMFGAGVKEDNKEAAAWYEKAAAQNDAPAQYKLAAMYDQGIGVAPDGGKAHELFLKAAAQGNQDAKARLAEFDGFLKRIRSMALRISEQSSAIRNVDRKNRLQTISTNLSGANVNMTTAQLKELDADVSIATALLEEESEFKTYSEVSQRRISSIKETLAALHFDAPLIQEIRSAIATANKAIDNADLKTLKAAIGDINRLYDPQTLNRLREAKEHGFETINDYDEYLAEKKKLGRSGIKLKPR